MNGRDSGNWLDSGVRRLLAWGAAVWLATVVPGGPPSTDNHVDELAAYLDRVQIAEPIVYHRLAVYPVLLEGDIGLRGDWLTLDKAISRGVLVITEKGDGGSVPMVIVKNRSRDEHVFIMAGEVIAGGKQTRTVRNDVVLAPGQQIELSVFCVEAHRWKGGANFSAAGALVPQSIQKELRRGTDQRRIWSEIARNNSALKAENETGSLERALKSRSVQDKLGKVRRSIVPNVPKGTMGFIFVDRGRAVGAEFFGRTDLAAELLPKLLDSYAVDFVLLRKDKPQRAGKVANRVAIEFFERIVRAGSRRTDTAGSGAGIRTRTGGLLGDGVSLGGVLVHYGVQIRERIVPPPKPRPPVPLQRRGNLQQRGSDGQ